jgi:hypothetical protein
MHSMKHLVAGFAESRVAAARAATEGGCGVFVCGAHVTGSPCPLLAVAAGTCCTSSRYAAASGIALAPLQALRVAAPIAGHSRIVTRTVASPVLPALSTTVYL